METFVFWLTILIRSSSAVYKSIRKSWIPLRRSWKFIAMCNYHWKAKRLGGYSPGGKWNLMSLNIWHLMMNASSVKENWHLLKSANNSKSCYIIILFILEWLCDEAFGFFFEFLTVFFFVTDRRDICFLCGIFLQKYICKVFFYRYNWEGNF